MFEVIGVVGGVASIIALFLPASSRSQRVIHAVYVLLIVAVSSLAVKYKHDLDRVNDAERSARALIKSQYSDFTPQGFNMAALAFLEKYRDIYRDSYARATELCNNNGCLQDQYRDGTTSLQHGYSQNEVSSALAGMLRGIAELNAKESR